MRPETNNETTRCELLKLGVATLGLVPATLRAQADDTAVVPFAYRASDEALIDLRRRLEQTRWPEGGAGRGWEQRPPLTKLQSLIAYWRSNYDWRRCETELNRWSHFKTTVDGLGIHFIHVRSPHPNALPIILTHGWPSTVLLFRDVIAPLTDPTAHGGTAADAFDVLVSRAPFAKLEAYRKERGWDVPWYSSFGTDFNYDFHVTNDPKVRPPEYNYRSKAENEAHKSPNNLLGEEHGLSVFFTLDGDVFHTYSAYARGTELFADARLILDATPYGRQQEFEDSPPGWPQKATYGKVHVRQVRRLPVSRAEGRAAPTES